MTIRLHIERLVIDGLPLEAEHGPVVQAAVEAELTRLLVEEGLAPGLQQGGALAYTRGADICTTLPSTPVSLGQQIGRALYGGIGK